MMEDQTSGFPTRRTIVTADNLDAVRLTLPEDQREHVTVGWVTWRSPSDVDTWADPCGSTLTYWPDGRGAVHHDGDLSGSSWGTWRGGELHLDDGIAIDVTSRVVRVWLGSTSIEMHDREPES